MYSSVAFRPEAIDAANVHSLMQIAKGGDQAFGFAGEALDRGLANAVTGTDLASRVGLDQLFFRDPWSERMDGREAYQHWLAQLLALSGGGFGGGPSTARRSASGTRVQMDAHRDAVGVRGAEIAVPIGDML